MGDRSRPLWDFAAFYRAHLDAVLAFCLARVRERELAAELAAEVFAAALIGRDGYRPERRLLQLHLELIDQVEEEFEHESANTSAQAARSLG